MSERLHTSPPPPQTDQGKTYALATTYGNATISTALAHHNPPTLSTNDSSSIKIQNTPTKGRTKKRRPITPHGITSPRPAIELQSPQDDEITPVRPALSELPEDEEYKRLLEQCDRAKHFNQKFDRFDRDIEQKMGELTPASREYNRWAVPFCRRRLMMEREDEYCCDSEWMLMRGLSTWEKIWLSVTADKEKER